MISNVKYVLNKFLCEFGLNNVSVLVARAIVCKDNTVFIIMFLYKTYKGLI